MLMEDEDVNITIGNLGAIMKANLFHDINYQKCEAPRMSAQDVSRDKKRLEKECKPFKKPGCCATKCCGAPTSSKGGKAPQGIRRPVKNPNTGNGNDGTTPRNHDEPL